MDSLSFPVRVEKLGFERGESLDSLSFPVRVEKLGFERGKSLDSLSFPLRGGKVWICCLFFPVRGKAWI